MPRRHSSIRSSPFRRSSAEPGATRRSVRIDREPRGRQPPLHRRERRRLAGQASGRRARGNSRPTSSSSPFRCRRAVRGTLSRSAVISRRARRSAKLSRFWPPAYIRATTTAASSSPKTIAAVIDSAATISRPTSPRRKLVDDLDKEHEQYRDGECRPDKRSTSQSGRTRKSKTEDEPNSRNGYKKWSNAKICEPDGHVNSAEAAAPA